MDKEQINAAVNAVKQQAANRQAPHLGPAKDALAPDEAAKIEVIMNEDIAKMEHHRAEALLYIARLDANIAEARIAIADVRRRAANVGYPEEPKNPAAPAPAGKK